VLYLENGGGGVIPLSKPFIEEDDIEVVKNVLKSSWLSMGPFTKKFESIVAEYVGVKYAVAVSSGTAALHLILKSADLPGKYMIVPSFTFVASANVAIFENKIPLFVDIDDRTFNVSPEALEDLLIRIEKGRYKFNEENLKIDDICCFMAVDIFGHPLDWDKIDEITGKYDIPVIEDSCEALGSEYKGRKVGTFGIAGAFAFYPNKQITTGEGGIIVTNDENVMKLSKSMRNQGRGEGGEWLLHVRLGYNYRMDEMSAALGYSQMKKIDRIIEMRNEVAERYSNLLKEFDGARPPVVEDYVSRMSWFVYVILLDEKISRDKVMDYMNNHGIQVRNYFQPVHLQPFYRSMEHREGELPITENISKRTLALPFYTSLSEEDQEHVVEVLKEAIEKVGF
jgi:perosamine synthetase